MSNLCPHFRHALLARACAPYRSAGLFAWQFARGKLAGDPAFFGLLERGLIPDNARILDLGCGQGLLAAFLLAAGQLHAAGQWPADWPAAPRPRHLRGIELMPRDVDRARRALGDRAEFVLGNICDTDFGEADAVVILDVLHYVDYAAQEAILHRVRAALPSSGVLLLRIGDAAGGLRFRFSNWVDHAVTGARGHRLGTLHCRSVADWLHVLGHLGFHTETLPMSQGTPFANVLLVARAV